MVWLRSFVFACVFYIIGAIIVLVAGVAALVSRRGAHWGARNWSIFVLWATRHILGIRLNVVGDIPSGATIVAMKHQSNYETLITPQLFVWPAVVMKAELIRIPVWGWIAKRHGSIPVDREASSGALRTMLKAAEAAKRENRQIVIFPEGTRTPVGEAPPLKPGVSGLYKMLKLPVVPVALNSGLVWPKKGFLKPAGTVTVRFGAPIPPGLPRKDFEDRLHAAINESV